MTAAPQADTPEDKQRMNGQKYNNLIGNNKGETLVEVMVAFIVLMIVLALFTGTINFASATVNNSIDIRRRSDSEYTALHSELSREAQDASYVSPLNTSNTRSVSLSDPGAVTDPGVSASLTAYQYKSGDTVYWVFK